MRRLMGIREFWLAKLRLPGDTLARAEKDPFVAQRAETIRELGVTPLPLVWVLGPHRKILVTGRDDVSALVKLGIPKVHGVAIDCTREEAFKISVADLMERRRVTQEEAEEMSAPLRSHQPYRVPPVELPDNMQPVVEQIMRQQPSEQLPDPDVNLVDLGMELTPDFREAVKQANSELAKSIYYLNLSRACLQRIATRCYQMAKPTRDRAERAVTEARAALEAIVPFALCPWCKGTDIRCLACHDSRWVTKEQYRAAPPKLLDLHDKVIVLDGKPVRLREVAE